MTVAKNSETTSIEQNDSDKIIRLLSSNNEFFNLLKSKFGIKNFDFLNLKNADEIIKFIKEKIRALISLIALNKDKISIFKIISAKKAINIIKKLLKIEAIK